MNRIRMEAFGINIAFMVFGCVYLYRVPDHPEHDGWKMMLRMG